MEEGDEKKLSWAERPMTLADLTEALKSRFLHPVSGLALALGTLKQRLSIINRFVVCVTCS
jgi:hypothetical protein